MLEPNMEHEAIVKYLVAVKRAEVARVPFLQKEKIDESYEFHKRISFMLQGMEWLEGRGKTISVKRPDDFDPSGENPDPAFLNLIEEAIDAQWEGKKLTPIQQRKLRHG